MRPLQSLPACLLRSKCVAFVDWATACDNEGHIVTRMQRASSCGVFIGGANQFPRKLHLCCQHIRGMKSRFAQKMTRHSPTIMAIARTKGYTVKTDIFQVEQISNNHPCWCWVLSLSLLGLYCTLHAWTQQHNNLLLLLTRERDLQGTG